MSGRPWTPERRDRFEREREFRRVRRQFSEDPIGSAFREGWSAACALHLHKPAGPTYTPAFAAFLNTVKDCSSALAYPLVKNARKRLESFGVDLEAVG